LRVICSEAIPFHKNNLATYILTSNFTSAFLYLHYCKPYIYLRINIKCEGSMQFTMSGNIIKLSRYGGSIGKGDERKTINTRIGSLPASVQPEFQTSATDNDCQKIPYAIYCSTTPNEHGELIEYIRKLRLEEAERRVRTLTTDLRSIVRWLPDANINQDDAQALLSACTAIVKAMRSADASRRSKPPCDTPQIAENASVSASHTTESSATIAQ